MGVAKAYRSESLALPLLLNPTEEEEQADEPDRDSLWGRLLFPSMRPGGPRWWPAWHALGWKLALALQVGLVSETNPLLPVGVFAVLSVATVSHQWQRPWRHALDNVLESAVLLTALGAYLLNIVAGSSGTNGTGSDSARNASLALVTAVQGMMLVALGICMWRRKQIEQWLAPRLRSSGPRS